MKKLVLAVCALFTAATSTQAGLYLNEDFSTYGDGNLVGQGGWVQYGTSVTLPIQVASGQVLMPGGQSADNQDAQKLLSSPIVAPGSGTISVFYGLSLNISSAAGIANPYYFAGLWDGGTFLNARLTAKDDGAGGYFLGARVNGQTGYPYGFGTAALSYGTAHKVIVQLDMVGGNANDIVNVFVDPSSLDLSMQTPYATGTYASGTVGDPTQAVGFLISQFSNGTNPNTGLTINNAAVGDSFADTAAAIGVVPEPSTAALLGIGLGALTVLRRRK